MKRIYCLLLAASMISVAACSKPLSSARSPKDVEYMSKEYSASPNDVYYAVRWALMDVGIPTSSENLQDGVILTDWVPVTSDSHYLNVFGRPDYGVTNTYHQLEVNIIPEGGTTKVKVGSRIKSLVAHLKSSGVLEKKVLDRIGNSLRKTEPEVTNLGVNQ